LQNVILQIGDAPAVDRMASSLVPLNIISRMENRQELKFTPCLKQPDPAIFWRNFINSAHCLIINNNRHAWYARCGKIVIP